MTSAINRILIRSLHPGVEESSESRVLVALRTAWTPAESTVMWPIFAVLPCSFRIQQMNILLSILKEADKGTHNSSGFSRV